MKGEIFNIQNFSVNDGPGIRTNVFLKGCPLRCIWCHNPEGQRLGKEILFYRDKCVGCGACVEVCPVGAHKMGENGHSFDRALCIGCGACTEKCLGDALSFYGKEMTVEELLPVLLEDRDFYETSGGGIKKMLGRLFSGDSLFINEYTPAGGNGMIAFAASFPGSIIPYQVTPGKVYIQSMPIINTAQRLIPYLPKPSSSDDGSGININLGGGR